MLAPFERSKGNLRWCQVANRISTLPHFDPGREIDEDTIILLSHINAFLLRLSAHQNFSHGLPRPLNGSLAGFQSIFTSTLKT
jgi:hypothetical protein